jgi:hypothetical protein
VRQHHGQRLGALGLDAVAGRLVAQASQHPRHQVRARPDQVLAAGLAPGAGGERVGDHLLQVVGHVQGAQHHTGDLVMAERVHVQPVVGEETRILDDLQAPLVGDDAVVPLGDRAHVLVVDRDLAAERAEHRGEVRVDAGEQHDRRARAIEARDHVVEQHGDLVGIGPRADDVVAPRTA